MEEILRQLRINIRVVVERHRMPQKPEPQQQSRRQRNPPESVTPQNPAASLTRLLCGHGGSIPSRTRQTSSCERYALFALIEDFSPEI
jgi:hypothetical protein